MKFILLVGFSICLLGSQVKAETPKGCAESLVAELILVPYSTVGINSITQLHALVDLSKSVCNINEDLAENVVVDTFRELCGSTLPCIRPDLIH